MSPVGALALPALLILACTTTYIDAPPCPPAPTAARAEWAALPADSALDLYLREITRYCRAVER